MGNLVLFKSHVQSAFQGQCSGITRLSAHGREKLDSISYTAESIDTSSILIKETNDILSGLPTHKYTGI